MSAALAAGSTVLAQQDDRATAGQPAAVRPSDVQPAAVRPGEVRTIALADLDLAALDFERLPTSDVLVLQERLSAVADHARAARVLELGIAAIENDDVPHRGNLAPLHQRRAEALRLLRRFSEAYAAVAESAACLDAFVAGFPPNDPYYPGVSAWGESLRCKLLGLRGLIELDCGALERASEQFDAERACLEAATTASIDSAQAWLDSDEHLASLAMAVGAPERIDALLDERRAIYADPTLASRAASLSLMRGGAWRERARRDGGSPAEAERCFESALADAALPVLGRVNACLWLADLVLDRGEVARALELWQRASAELDALGAPAARQQRRRIGVAARLAASGALDRATWREETARELARLLDGWSELDAREGGWGLLHFDDSLRLFCEHAQLCVELDGRERGAVRALEPILELHVRNSLARELGAAVPTLEQVQTSLCSAGEGGVLVYVAGPVQSWLFVIDGASVAAVPLVDQFTIDRATRALVRELHLHAGDWTDTLRRESQRLGDALVPSAVRERIAAWQTIVVTGLDTFLGEIPFELCAAGSAQPLGIERAVWNVPSLAVGVALAARARGEAPATAAAARAPRIRFVGAPSPSSGPTSAESAAATGDGRRSAAATRLPAFELDPRVVERVLRVFPLEARDVRLADAAHAGAFDGPATEILQVVAHGDSDVRRVRSAGLALAASADGDDGFFGAEEVEACFGRAGAPRVVVVAACRAGKGAARRGDGAAAELGTAFLGAGSQVVLESDFDLELELACRLSEEFYARLAGGAHVAEALRGARAALASDDTLARSAEPLLVRVDGFAPVPFARWSVITRSGASLSTRAAPWLIGSLVVVAGLWAVTRRRAS
ncbi:MAG: CHAT domain-containing protein [Planctomycetes bacterium]|nr:CHAT domain-containing protein [Planctomycetota bacterium]